MKKKTVITTEKREVWVIRRPLESGQESDDEAVRPQEEKEALAVLTGQLQTEDAPHLETNDIEEGV